MNKIKILRLIARLNIGGPAIHTILLTQGLDQARFESLLVCGSIGKDEGDMSYYALEKDVKPFFIPQLRRELNFFNDSVSFLKILRLIFTLRPDIIHTHTAKAGTLGRASGIIYNICNLLSNRKIRLVHTFHGHVFEGYFSFFKTKLFIYIERVLSYFTSKIITVSAAVKNELILLGISKANKIEVVPLGFELDKFLDITLRDNDVLSIGVVGRLVPVKNHHLFLKSAAKLLKENPGVDLRFKIIGDGELRKELVGYSRILGISDYVDFLGWQRDLVKVYSGLDIVALTSLNEGTPVSIIEAM
ncbi:MAG: glycosyltransferase, partial [Candidatus Omnitrophica bacterium]|nr:glycosyltransferase [Candidatus Omnitrophota bacterium]